MKYQNRKNGKVAELVSTNEKFKTVRLRYEDGTERDYNTSTLGKSFKKLAEEASVAVVQPVVEKKEEIVEAAPVVEEPDDVQKSVQDLVLDAVMQFVQENSFTVKSRGTKYWFNIKVNGHAVVELLIKKNGLMTMYVSTAVAEKLANVYTTIKNYYLPAVMKNVDIDSVKRVFTIK